MEYWLNSENVEKNQEKTKKLLLDLVTYLTFDEFKEYVESGLKPDVWIEKKFGVSGEEFIKKQKEEMMVESEPKEEVATERKMPTRKILRNKVGRPRGRRPKKPAEEVDLSLSLAVLEKIAKKSSSEISKNVEPSPDTYPNPVLYKELVRMDQADKHRYLFCVQYDNCLDKAAKARWSGFSCTQCPYFNDPLLHEDCKEVPYDSSKGFNCALWET